MNSMSSTESGYDPHVQRTVREMYLSVPFPQWNHEKRLQRLPAEMVRYRYLGFESEMEGANFLDVGCGTGNRSMMIAQRLEVASFTGFDMSTKSLEIARKVAQEESFDRFRPVEGSLFEMPFPDNTFDVVVSWGVLHHTSNPIGGLKEMVRVCKPGGSIGLFVYNNFADWRHNLQKNKVSRLAGEDVDKRFEIAHRLYGRKPVSEMTPEEIAVFYDQYCHPHKSDHSIGEVLDWFRQLNLEYSGSYPPLRFRDSIRAIRFRGELTDEFPLRRSWLNKIFRWARYLPFPSRPQSSYRRPTILHRAFWQMVYAWQGRGGMYSHGAALGARKPQQS